MGQYPKIRYQPGGKMEFLREPYVCYFSNTDGDFVLLNRTAAALPTLR
jgi:hypothetical protein